MKRTPPEFIASAMTLVNSPVSLSHGNLLDTGFAPVVGYPCQLYYQPTHRHIVAIATAPIFMAIPALKDHALYSVCVAFPAGAAPSIASLHESIKDSVREIQLPFDSEGFVIAIEEGFEVEEFEPVSGYSQMRCFVAVDVGAANVAMNIDLLRAQVSKWDAIQAQAEGVHYIGGDATRKH